MTEIAAYPFTIQEINEQTEFINVHLNEAKEVMVLEDAKDATIFSHNNSRNCEVREKHIIFETQQFRIIQDEDFTDKDYEQDTVLNFRQFVSMVHIKDGMLAITSDSIIYVLKFNYNNVFEHDFEESGSKFAKIIWKANLQTIAPSIVAKNELPQLVYSPTSNLVFLIFSDSAQLFSMAQMEYKANSLDVYVVTDWKKRGFRGLTKEIDGLLFSAVGKDGLDVYKIVEKDLQFVKNLKLRDFGLNTTMEVVDFAIIKYGLEEGFHSMFLLDKDCGLLLIDIHKNQYINFGLKAWISYQSGGISVDTSNGKNVFMAFQQFNHNFVIEFNVDIDRGTSYEISRKKINHRIIDIDATDNLAIVQGQNQHHILFSNGYDFVMPHHTDQVFTHIGLRDFEFFSQSYKLQDIQDLTKEYQYDQFFFGITAQSAFLTRFQVEPIKIVCLHYSELDVGQKFSYTLQFNTTIEGIPDLVQRHTKNIEVEIVETYFFDSQYWGLSTAAFSIFSFLLLSLFFCLCYLISQKRQEQQLSELIESVQRRKDSKAQNGSTIKGDETSVFQVQNKSLAPQ